jgi:Uma2 family endonuclease
LGGVAQPIFAPRPIDIYRRLLDEDVRVELIDGEVIVHAAPGMLHGFGASGVGSDLYQAYQRGRGGPGGWWILDEVDVYLEEALQAYRPDIAGWRRERVPRIPQERPISIVPDFVCEVLSASNARWELGPKRDGYRRAGVRWYWILDPRERKLDAHELADGEYRHVGSVTAEEPGALPPFEAVRLVMSEIFPIEGE